MSMILVIFGFLFFFLAIGVPIAMALGVASLATMLIDGGIDFVAVGQRFIAANDSFPLLAAPFFMFSGSVLTHGGISKRLVKFCQTLVGHFHGGLAMVATVTSMFFAAISGSSAATTAAVGGTLIPEMENEGYERSYSAATIAAAGTTGIVIPPSTPMVVFGVATGVSIGKLLMGGLIPGLIMGLAMMIVIHFQSKTLGYGGAEKATGKERLKAFVDAIWGIMVPVIILGGIYGGIFTPTESAAVACVYGLFVAIFVYKEVKFKDLIEITIDAVKSTCMVSFILTTAGLFGWLLTYYQVPQKVAVSMMALSQNRFVIMILINILLLFVGTFLNATSAISILAPILYPVAVGVGMNPVAFGVIMVVNLAIGCITPPVGVDLFVAQGITKVPIEKIAARALPYLGALLLVLVLISAFPEIIMVLPNLLSDSATI